MFIQQKYLLLDSGDAFEISKYYIRNGHSYFLYMAFPEMWLSDIKN